MPLIQSNTRDHCCLSQSCLPRLTNGQQSVVPLDLSEPVEVGWEVDRGQTISAVDYWFEPVAWIAWKQSGQPLSRSPMPRAEQAAPPV